MKLYKIKKSNIDNKGLYARQNIKDRTRIIEYKGKIITKKKVVLIYLLKEIKFYEIYRLYFRNIR